jgi:transcriptional regulator with XRE-family HTH domain
MDMEFESLKGYPLCYKLEKLRWIKNLTQEQLAKELGCTPRTIFNWETGYRTPMGRFLEKIRLFYGLPLDFFIGDNIEAIKKAGKKKKE